MRRFLPSTSTDKPHAATKLPPLLEQQAYTPQPSSSSHRQFAAPPKFAFGSSDKKPTATEHSSRRPPLSSSPFTSGLINRHDEDIEEPSLKHGQEDVRRPYRPSYFDVDQEIEVPQADNEASILSSATPSKRRRLLQPPISNVDQISISSSPSSSGSPPMIPQPVGLTSPADPSTPPPFHPRPNFTNTSTHPRFHFALPTHSSPPSTSTKPSFLLPAVPQSPPSSFSTALSSPHRRGQKYLPGGLASTVREWVFETSQDATRGNLVRSRKAEDKWDLVLQAADVKSINNVGEGMTLLKGMASSDGRLSKSKWILMGKPKIKSSEEMDGSRMSVGVNVAIKKPTWDLIFLGDEKWQVGVEWTVIADPKMELDS